MRPPPTHARDPKQVRIDARLFPFEGEEIGEIIVDGDGTRSGGKSGR